MYGALSLILTICFNLFMIAVCTEFAIDVLSVSVFVKVVFLVLLKMSGMVV